MVPLLLRGLETAQRELLSLHCPNPLQTASPCHHLSTPLPRKFAKPKAAQGHVTDYTRERKRKEKEAKEQAGNPANLLRLTEVPVYISWSHGLKGGCEEGGRGHAAREFMHSPCLPSPGPARGIFPPLLHWAALQSKPCLCHTPDYTKMAGPHEKTHRTSSTKLIWVVMSQLCQCKWDGESTPQR